MVGAQTRHLDRALWQRWTGDHAEVASRRPLFMTCRHTKMRDLRLCGERIISRALTHQTAEIQIRIAIMPRFNAFDTAKIAAVARNRKREGGGSVLNWMSASTPRQSLMLGIGRRGQDLASRSGQPGEFWQSSPFSVRTEATKAQNAATVRRV